MPQMEISTPKSPDGEDTDDDNASFLIPQVKPPNKKESTLSESNAARNKVSLKPGHSLMDWIKFTHTINDLSSTGGQARPVNLKELSKHNKRKDAWIGLKGKVYNITPYLDYHPGGEDELMKGAGKDATQLFNQVHSWINAESMLKKCYIGPLESTSLGSKSGIQEENDPVSGPKLDWTQTASSISVHIQNSKKRKQRELIPVTTDLIGKKLFLTMKCTDGVYKYKVAVPEEVSSEYEVQVNEDRTVVKVVLQKIVHQQWEKLKFYFIRYIAGNQGLSYRPCKLACKVPVNYNTSLFSFELPSETKMFIPIGHHVNIKTSMNGTDVIRSYTPVPSSFSSDEAVSNGVSRINLMVKVYSSGVLTPVLDNCKTGETMFISDCLGSFSERKLKAYTAVVLFAAGTGLTPMIRIIMFCLSLEEEKIRKCLLITFNKSKKDILWSDQIKSFSEKDTRFSVVDVLSDPDPDWNGVKGVVSKEMICDIIPFNTKEEGTLFCVCGPTSFSKLTLKYLKELGHDEINIHMFLG